MPFELAEAARVDVATILTETMRCFGPLQRRRYGELMEVAAEMTAANPNRPGSRSREDLASGLRSFSVERASRRRGAAAHVLYYVQATLDAGHEGVIILRVLHERMDPARHLIAEE